MKVGPRQPCALFYRYQRSNNSFGSGALAPSSFLPPQRGTCASTHLPSLPLSLSGALSCFTSPTSRWDHQAPPRNLWELRVTADRWSKQVAFTNASPLPGAHLLLYQIHPTCWCHTGRLSARETRKKERWILQASVSVFKQQCSLYPHTIAYIYMHALASTVMRAQLDRKQTDVINSLSGQCFVVVSAFLSALFSGLYKNPVLRFACRWENQIYCSWFTFFCSSLTQSRCWNDFHVTLMVFYSVVILFPHMMSLSLSLSLTLVSLKSAH